MLLQYNGITGSTEFIYEMIDNQIYLYFCDKGGFVSTSVWISWSNENIISNHTKRFSLNRNDQKCLSYDINEERDNRKADFDGAVVSVCGRMNFLSILGEDVAQDPVNLVGLRRAGCLFY